VFFCCCSLVVLSCREIRPLEPSNAITGYQIDGIVTTLNGIPLDSVAVIVYYSYTPVSETPLDTVQMFVTDTTKTLRVSVYTTRFVPVRVLYRGNPHRGFLPRYSWDGRDDRGHFVQSGKYLIRYVYDTTVVKTVPYLAEGLQTAITNSSGEFTIPNDNLPVGELFDFYFSNGTYDATYQVEPEVELIFSRGVYQSPYDVVLQKDAVTQGVFKLG